MALSIEVAFASETKQQILCLKVPKGTNIREAIQASGILELFSEIDLLNVKVGIFGKLRDLCDQVKAGDRIEIYRPLKIDPKIARRMKARNSLNNST